MDLEMFIRRIDRLQSDDLASRVSAVEALATLVPPVGCGTGHLAVSKPAPSAPDQSKPR